MIRGQLDQILHCPKCHHQHIDEAQPDICQDCGHAEDVHHDSGCATCWQMDRPCYQFNAWLNPPHKSHRCSNCNTVWRPADFCTNGVAKITTRGENDSWPELTTDH